ncbi:MAG: hypothetical protein HY372_02465 [Candidatus Andersenbacteria bacterium]|nr:hypothetical protein [Candidatus Andersenbacteria bacterium]
MLNATLLEGLAHDDNSFDAVIPTETLAQITHDPRNLEDPRYLQRYPDLADLAKERERIQRPFKSQKKANVPKYRDYMIQVKQAAADQQRPFGAVPSITLWTDRGLDVITCPLNTDNPLLQDVRAQFLKVPHDVKLIAIDGETQLAARYDAGVRLHGQKARVTIHYGKSRDWAVSAFVDLNTKAISMNKEMVVTKSPDDVLARIAKRLGNQHASLYKRIKETDTVILQNEHWWMTLGKLRLFVACVWRGKPGVAIGSRPTTESEFREEDASADRVFDACTKFWDVVASYGEPIIKAFERRNETVIGTPAVIAALGAIAHTAAGGKGLPLATDTEELTAKLTEAIRSICDVNWFRGPHWDGLCGRWTPPPKQQTGQGKFRIGGGAKDGMYNVYRALFEDPESDGYQRIRTSRVALAV